MKCCRILIFLFIFTSCVPALLYHAGIRVPKEETPESIIKYAEENKQDVSNIFIFSDSAGWCSFQKDSSYKKGFLSALVFNKYGLIENFKDSNSCQWSVAKYVAQLKNDSVYKVNSSKKGSGLMAWINPVTGGTSPVFDTAENDFLVVVTWAKFITKMNERLFSVIDSAEGNKNADIKVISLNLDMQKSWNLKDKLRLR